MKPPVFASHYATKIGSPNDQFNEKYASWNEDDLLRRIRERQHGNTLTKIERREAVAKSKARSKITLPSLRFMQGGPK